MRITNAMLVTNYMSNMQRNLSNMSTIQDQLSSSKNVSRASENPYVAVRTMQLNSEIRANAQYNTNIQDTTNWLNTTDTALGQANNILRRIKELTIKAGNGAYGMDEVGAIKDEIVEKFKEFGQVLNTTFDGNYIFGGTKSTTKPVQVDDNGNIAYSDKDGNTFTVDSSGAIKNYKNRSGENITDTQLAKTTHDQIKASLKTEVSDGVTVDYNKTAVDILEFENKLGQPINVMDKFSDIIKCLSVASGEATANVTLSDGTTIAKDKESDALSKINGTLMTSLDYISQNVSKIRSGVGAVQNRMESAKKTNEEQNYNMTSILSNTEDVDYTQKSMEYAVLQTVYTATLQTSSKVLMNTLLDYVR
ncbi:MAG: flagellar hook-associated protein 3 [Clostridium butyricum]|nr:flagellar hook-associated protein 3 [Clostridium butyricum]